MKTSVTCEVEIPSAGFRMLQWWLGEAAVPLEDVARLAAQKYVNDLVEMYLSLPYERRVAQTKDFSPFGERRP